MSGVRCGEDKQAEGRRDGGGHYGGGDRVLWKKLHLMHHGTYNV